MYLDDAIDHVRAHFAAVNTGTSGAALKIRHVAPIALYLNHTTAGFKAMMVYTCALLPDGPDLSAYLVMENPNGEAEVTEVRGPNPGKKMRELADAHCDAYAARLMA
jgi:hypothetical protein